MAPPKKPAGLEETRTAESITDELFEIIDRALTTDDALVDPDYAALRARLWRAKNEEGEHTPGVYIRLVDARLLKLAQRNVARDKANAAP